MECLTSMPKTNEKMKVTIQGRMSISENTTKYCQVLNTNKNQD